MLAPWKKSYDQPRQHIKNKRHYFSIKVCIVKAMLFAIVTWMWVLDHKEVWVPKNRCFWTVVLDSNNLRVVIIKLLLRVPWTARRSNQSIQNEINPEYSLEGLMLKRNMQRANSLEKILMLGKTEGRRSWGQQEDEMLGGHHQLNGHEFEQALGDGEGQGSLACHSSRGHKELDTTEWLNDNNNELWDPGRVLLPL